nr:SLATT domain-containing protein [uncultured Anaerobutyricum sp.]
MEQKRLEAELIHKIKETYILRDIACQRLKIQDFWTKILGTYYSIFTALLAIISVKENAEFLALPSACFTVGVAILVCVANAQNFAGRAHDLEVNVEDLKSLEDSIQIDKVNGEDICKEGYKKYRKKCADSEKEGLIDYYKYYGYKRYKYIMALEWILLISFFLLPIIYIIIDRQHFLLLFKS